MSEKINCAACGMMLYYGEEIARRLYMRAIPSEETVLGFYDHECPRCGGALAEDTITVEIKKRRTHGA